MCLFTEMCQKISASSIVANVSPPFEQFSNDLDKWVKTVKQWGTHHSKQQGQGAKSGNRSGWNFGSFHCLSIGQGKHCQAEWIYNRWLLHRNIPKFKYLFWFDTSWRLYLSTNGWLAIKIMSQWAVEFEQFTEIYKFNC